MGGRDVKKTTRLLIGLPADEVLIVEMIQVGDADEETLSLENGGER